MRKHIILCMLIALGLVHQSCTSSEQQAERVAQEKEEVSQPSADVAEVPQKAALSGTPGEQLFNNHCKKCHPGGGNIINSQKTLFRDVLNSNNINTPEDIINTMRNPGKGMPRFGEEKISNGEAKKIGEYILETYK